MTFDAGTTTTHTPSPLRGTHGGKPREPLVEIAKRLRARMRDLHTGQSEVAIEVARLAEHWDTKHKEEADGMELGPWLVKHVDPTIRLNRYMDLAAAAERAKTMTSRVESPALLWMHRQIPEDAAFHAALGEVSKTYKEQGSRPVKMSQVKRICSRYSVPAKGRAGLRDEVRALKDRVGRLEAQVRRLGEEPVE